MIGFSRFAPPERSVRFLPGRDVQALVACRPCLKAEWQLSGGKAASPQAPTCRQRASGAMIPECDVRSQSLQGSLCWQVQAAAIAKKQAFAGRRHRSGR